MKAPNIKKFLTSTSLAVLAAFCLYPSVSNAGSDEAATGIMAAIAGLFFTGFFSLWFLFVAAIFCLNIVGMVVWVLMLIDCVKRDFPNENDKVVWLLVLIFTGWIGALIYYFVIKREEDSTN